MKRSGLQVVLASAIGLSLLSFPSCGRERRLVSISVSPSGAHIFAGPGNNPPVTLQFTAVGNYIHPPQTRDITTQVVWKSADRQVVDFVTSGQPGLATSQGACGTNIGISAIVYSNPSNPPAGTANIGTATVDVTIPGNPICP